MALIETEGLVLRSYNLSDADKIIVFITQQEGLVRGVAKGAKRLKSKFGGSLEPFSIVNITYFQKEERELVSIRQIELEKSFFKSTSDINFLQKFEYIAELLIEFAPPHDPNERLYKMSKACLEAASESPQDLEGIALYFELWLLRLGGFLPNWEKCIQCKKDFLGEMPAYLQLEFHIVCTNCQSSRNKHLISDLQRKFYSLAQQVSPKRFVQLTKDNKDDLREVSNILKRIISQVLGKELIGKKILTAKF